ncbi:MAG: 3-phosphoserine/phosphohydroxythreonine transaminase [Oscillospiraceae bacterium]|nr:3-phosphoserine/phosphohydroxythreonine transaminase [Oscillospiraceae bacterium]
MNRVYNFSPGPACLPLKVLEKAAGEMTNYNNSGMSVMEMSHRSKIYEEIIAETQSCLREVMGIPDNYKVLFLQGGASLQFAAVPMNLMNNSGKADYVITGQFSKAAFDEAVKYGGAKIIASSKDENFTYIPEITPDIITPDADYLHICENNTIFGTRFNKLPEVINNIPLVADVSSCILSQPMDVSKYGLMYAGAQKNMGPSGLTVVIVRDDLIGKARESTPKVIDYKIQSENDSMINTPPCYSVYIAQLVFKWLRDDIGGLENMRKINIEKANILYDFIDNSELFKNPVKKEFRSIMNVTFVTGDKDTDAKFIKEAAGAGLVTLGGHRLVGGMRASIYNAMPTDGVKALVEFMKKFESENK